MRIYFKTALVVAAFAAAAAAAGPAAAQSARDQLAANAGLSPSQAEGLTLGQIAAFHVNRGESIQDRQAIPGWIPGADSTAAAGNLVLGFEMSSRNQPGLTLAEIATIAANRSESFSDRWAVTRPMPGAGSDHRQLAAAAGLGLDGAEGRSATELAAILANRGESIQDRQPVRD